MGLGSLKTTTTVWKTLALLMNHQGREPRVVTDKTTPSHQNQNLECHGWKLMSRWKLHGWTKVVEAQHINVHHLDRLHIRSLLEMHAEDSQNLEGTELAQRSESIQTDLPAITHLRPRRLCRPRQTPTFRQFWKPLCHMQA